MGGYNLREASALQQEKADRAATMFLGARLNAFIHRFAAESCMTPAEACHFLLNEGMRRTPTIAHIKAVVAARFQVSVSDLTSIRRDKHTALARQIVMYLAREMTPKSLPMIGRELGNRDHTTILHGIRRIKELRQSDAALDRVVRDLIARLGGLNDDIGDGAHLNAVKTAIQAA